MENRKLLSRKIRRLKSAQWLFNLFGALIFVGMVALMVWVGYPFNVFFLLLLPIVVVVILSNRLLQSLSVLVYYEKELGEDDEVIARRDEVDTYLRETYPEDYAEETTGETAS